jgi:uncharacterized membrane protein YbjE (DUF340 family)
MTIGIFIGFTIQDKTKIVKAIDPMISMAIYALLFLLGISVGTNEIIISNLDILGAQALLLTLGGVMGSVVLAFFTYKFFFKTKK